MTDNDDGQSEYFEYVTDMVDEMNELYMKHEALVEEYSRAMEYINLRGWRQAYVQMAEDRIASREDGRNGDSSD